MSYQIHEPHTHDAPADAVVDEVRVLPTPPSGSPVVQRVVEPVPVTTTRSTRRFMPDAVIAAAAGIALLIIGLIAITRGGFDGSLSEPTVEVLGFGHTTGLGLLEIAFGVALLAAGAGGSRGAAVFFGGALGILAFVGAVQTESFRDSLGLESGFAWLVVAIAAVVVTAALLMPRLTARITTYDTGVYDAGELRRW